MYTEEKRKGRENDTGERQATYISQCRVFKNSFSAEINYLTLCRPVLSILQLTVKDRLHHSSTSVNNCGCLSTRNEIIDECRYLNIHL